MVRQVMTANTSPLARIELLKAEIAKLEQEAVAELQARRLKLMDELAEVNAKLHELTGSVVVGPSPKRRQMPSGKSVPLQELKEMLANAPDKTLNIRKEGLELKNIKTLADANPHLLKLGGKGAWPTITLLK